MSDQDRRFWDKAARKYATSPIADMAGFEKTLTRTREFLAPGHRVLELGCGTGTTAMRLADAVENYLATDISEEMIAISREKFVGSGRTDLAGRLSFRQATASTLASENSRYDAVLGFNYLHLAGDTSAVLGNIRRVLKPHGLFISKTPCVGDMNPLVRLAIPLMRLVGKAPSSVTPFSTISLEREIRTAGFELLQSELHGSQGKDVRPFIVARAL